MNPVQAPIRRKKRVDKHPQIVATDIVIAFAALIRDVGVDLQREVVVVQLALVAEPLVVNGPEEVGVEGVYTCVHLGATAEVV